MIPIWKWRPRNLDEPRELSNQRQSEIFSKLLFQEANLMPTSVRTWWHSYPWVIFCPGSGDTSLTTKYTRTGRKLSLFFRWWRKGCSCQNNWLKLQFCLLDMTSQAPSGHQYIYMMQLLFQVSYTLWLLPRLLINFLQWEENAWYYSSIMKIYSEQVICFGGSWKCCHS